MTNRSSLSSEAVDSGLSSPSEQPSEDDDEDDDGTENDDGTEDDDNDGTTPKPSNTSCSGSAEPNTQEYGTAVDTESVVTTKSPSVVAMKSSAVVRDTKSTATDVSSTDSYPELCGDPGLSSSTVATEATLAAQQTDFSESELLPQSDDIALSPRIGSRPTDNEVMLRLRCSSPNSFSCLLFISFFIAIGGGGGGGNVLRLDESFGIRVATLDGGSNGDGGNGRP